MRQWLPLLLSVLLLLLFAMVPAIKRILAVVLAARLLPPLASTACFHVDAFAKRCQRVNTFVFALERGGYEENSAARLCASCLK